MALTVPIITAGYAGSSRKPGEGYALPGHAVWTERHGLPYTTVKAAPDLIPSHPEPVFTVTFPVDTIICIGAEPDAANGAVYFVPALTELTYYARPGDKLAARAAA